MSCEEQSSTKDFAERKKPKRSFVIRVVAKLYRTTRGLLALGMLLHIVLVCTPVPEAFYRWLAVTSKPSAADVVVCLGGSPSRIIWAAEIYHRGLANRVVVSNCPGAAQFMKRQMIWAGVPADHILVDENSYATGDHPAGVAQVARLAGFDTTEQRFLLVTHHDHSRRSAACFRKAGYRNIAVFGGPFPLDYLEPGKLWRWRVKIIPEIVYELAAMAQYEWQGKM